MNVVIYLTCKIKKLYFPSVVCNKAHGTLIKLNVIRKRDVYYDFRQL